MSEAGRIAATGQGRPVSLRQPGHDTSARSQTPGATYAYQTLYRTNNHESRVDHKVTKSSADIPLSQPHH